MEINQILTPISYKGFYSSKRFKKKKKKKGHTNEFKIYIKNWIHKVNRKKKKKIHDKHQPEAKMAHWGQTYISNNIISSHSLNRSRKALVKIYHM